MESVTCQKSSDVQSNSWTVFRQLHMYFKKSNTTQLWSIIFLESWIYIRHVWYNVKACLLVFPLVPLFVLIPSLQHAQGEKMGGNVKKVLEIQHDVLFWRILVRQLRMTDRTQNMTYHLLTIRSNLSFVTLPPIYTPYTCPCKTIITNKASIDGLPVISNMIINPWLKKHNQSKSCCITFLKGVQAFQWPQVAHVIWSKGDVNMS